MFSNTLLFACRNASHTCTLPVVCNVKKNSTFEHTLYMHSLQGLFVLTVCLLTCDSVLTIQVYSRRFRHLIYYFQAYKVCLLKAITHIQRLHHMIIINTEL